MKNTASMPQKSTGRNKDSSGLGSSGRLDEAGSGNARGLDNEKGLELKERSEASTKDDKNGGILQNAPTHQKRRRYDERDGHPLISKGFLIRADIDRKYSIKATILHAKKYELVNDALL